MSLNLWDLVQGTATLAQAAEAAVAAEFRRRVTRALSTIVLAVSPSLLYLNGPDPDDPVVVWRKLELHFQCSSWANQFAIRKKLYSLKMEPNILMCQHIKHVTELVKLLARVSTYQLALFTVGEDAMFLDEIFVVRVSLY